MRLASHRCCARLLWEHARAPMWVKNERKKEGEKAFPLFCAFSRMWVIDRPSSSWQIKTYFICHKNLQWAIKTLDYHSPILPHFKSLNHSTLTSLKGKKISVTVKNDLLEFQNLPQFFLDIFLLGTSQDFPTKMCGRAEVSIAFSYRGVSHPLISIWPFSLANVMVQSTGVGLCAALDHPCCLPTKIFSNFSSVVQGSVSICPTFHSKSM